ncbi:MAG: hypothetical protein ACREUG_09250 [Steroidobacteraceae bacterium]
MTATDRVKLFGAAHALVRATNPRMPHTTEEAIALVKELDPTALKHGPQAVASAALFEQLVATTPPADRKAALDHYTALDAAERQFWDGFEQESVAGVEIIRRR